jgi:hypothetical protein
VDLHQQLNQSISSQISKWTNFGKNYKSTLVAVTTRRCAAPHGTSTISTTQRELLIIAKSVVSKNDKILVNFSKILFAFLGTLMVLDLFVVSENVRAGRNGFGDQSPLDRKRDNWKYFCPKKRETNNKTRKKLKRLDH